MLFQRNTGRTPCLAPNYPTAPRVPPTSSRAWPGTPPPGRRP